MIDKIYTINEIIEISKPIFVKYGIKEVSIFGSYAKEKADKNSDIDFLIIPPDNFNLLDMFALENELKISLNKEVDLVSKNPYTRDLNKEISNDGIKAKELFYNDVYKERKIIYG